MKKKQSTALLVALTLAFSAYILNKQTQPDQIMTSSSGSTSRAGGGKSMAPVGIVIAQNKDIDLTASALGTVSALNIVIVKSRVDGLLQKINFTEGQWVHAGQVLAEIDAQPFKIQLAQAEGQLAKDQAMLNGAQLDLARYRLLLTQDSIPQQQVETQDALVKQYQGSIAADQAQVAQAKLLLSYTKITAPIAGRLGLRQLDMGNMIRSADANGLVMITQTQPISVQFSLPLEQVSSLLTATDLKRSVIENSLVEAYDQNNQTRLAEGNVISIDNQLDASTSTLKIKAQFANKNQALFPNQFVNITLHKGKLKQAIVLPLACIQKKNQNTFVYRIEADNTVKVQAVTLGPVVNDQVVISQGVQAGERIAIDGTDRLKDGGKVSVIDPSAPITKRRRQSNESSSGAIPPVSEQPTTQQRAVPHPHSK